MSAVAAAGSRRLAPELPARLQWVNCDDASAAYSSPGRVVLIWFFTVDDVHCRNLLPELQALADRHHDGVVVLGVHCARHDEQVAADVLRKAINRLGIRHPVANDPAMRLWDSFKIRAWPSVVALDAQGRIALLAQGEDCAVELDGAVRQLLDEANALQIRVFDAALEAVRPEPASALRFPSRVLATDEHLYISDSGKDRVLMCDHNGRVLQQFGAGIAGWADGVGNSVLLDNPQGLAMVDGQLFIADQGNHCVRAVALRGGTVSTVAGTGTRGYARPDDAPGRTAAMSAPADLLHANGRLIIALAGLRQIWSLDLATQRVSILAGSGNHGATDGSADSVEFGQPEALALSGSRLVVADPGNGAIRSVDLADGTTTTLVGPAGALGADGQPVLRYPLALAAAGRNVLFVVDCHDDSVKAVSSSTGQVRKLATSYRFQQPQGLAIAGNTLWVANTNAHEVVRIDLGSGAVKRVAIDE